ncbi:hypothetical protein [Streptomyces sp. NPDC006784]|uniref:hypothetical protein n=1 Tax=Streptomyces sp. NPDC006784 TaxID=3364764 RepID=UPI00367A697A
MPDINDVIAARIEQARRKAAADREHRQRRARARAAGLAKRHARKLRHLAETDNTSPAASGAL